MKLVQQRTHMASMVEYATNPDALVYVQVAGINDTSFFILVDKPLWEDDRVYRVRDDLTLDEAKNDRKETLAALEEAKEAQAILAQY